MANLKSFKRFVGEKHSPIPPKNAVPKKKKFGSGGEFIEVLLDEFSKQRQFVGNIGAAKKYATKYIPALPSDVRPLFDEYVTAVSTALTFPLLKKERFTSLGKEPSVTPQWTQWSGKKSDKPKTDLIGSKHFSVKFGKSQAGGANAEELRALIMSAITSKDADKISSSTKKTAKEVAELVEHLATKLNGVEKVDGKEWTDYINTIRGKLKANQQDLMNLMKNDIIRNAFVEELMTGEKKFGTKAEGHATDILYIKKKIYKPLTGSIKKIAPLISGEIGFRISFTGDSFDAGRVHMKRFRLRIRGDLDFDLGDILKENTSLTEGLIKDVLKALFVAVPLLVGGAGAQGSPATPAVRTEIIAQKAVDAVTMNKQLMLQKLNQIKSFFENFITMPPEYYIPSMFEFEGEGRGITEEGQLLSIVDRMEYDEDLYDKVMQ